MARELKPCGTQAAYARHIRHGESPCPLCTKANAEAVANNANSKAYRRAKQRAFTRLSHIYATAYDALLAEELAKEKTR